MELYTCILYTHTKKKIDCNERQDKWEAILTINFLQGGVFSLFIKVLGKLT